MGGYRKRHRGTGCRRAALVGALTLVAGASLACSSDGIVTTDDAPPAAQTSTTIAPPLPPPPNNDALANAFDFATQQNDETAYYFTSPSKRWSCAVIPRRLAGCQSSTGSTIPITGAPATVPDAQGADVAPDAIEVGVDTDARFASVEAPGYALVPGPTTVLPFGKVLIVAGFRCNVQEATGISCASEVSGKGFTFDADGYTQQYTNLPQ